MKNHSDKFYKELQQSIIQARRRVIEQLKTLSADLDITFNNPNDFVIQGNWNDKSKIIGIDENMFVVNDQHGEEDFLDFDDEKLPTELLLSILLDIEAKKYTNNKQIEYPKLITFNLSNTEWIKVEISSPGAAKLDSNLVTHEDGENPDDDDWSDYINAVDGMESLILSMASTGINLDAPKMHEAIKNCFEAIANHTP